MAETVIHNFEPVDVQEEHGEEIIFLPLGSFEQPVEPVHEQGAIR